MVRGAVANPAAFLATTTTRLAINALRSARCAARRTSGRGSPNRSTRARTHTWAPKAGEALELAALLQTSAVMLGNGTVYAVLTVTASTERIDHVLWMVNPEKITVVSVPA
jgi:DNA-directed RNA polymerase specialized sigma24 family protein